MRRIHCVDSLGCRSGATESLSKENRSARHRRTELSSLGKEKLVSVAADESRCVCPVQGCRNTMRRVPN